MSRGTSWSEGWARITGRAALELRAQAASPRMQSRRQQRSASASLGTASVLATTVGHMSASERQTDESWLADGGGGGSADVVDVGVALSSRRRSRHAASS